jgi:hypothetical protein
MIVYVAVVAARIWAGPQPKRSISQADSAPRRFAPLNLETDRLPRNYTGHSIEALIKRFSHSPKSEFETDSEFQARVATTGNEYFGVVLGQGEAAPPKIDYRPDEEVFRGSLYTGYSVQTYGVSGNTVTFDVRRIRTVVRHYTATNAFGAKWAATQVKISDFGILVSESDLTRFGFEQSFEFPMTAEEAKECKPFFAFLLVFAPSSGPAGVTITEHEVFRATIDIPTSGESFNRYIWSVDVSLWCFNRRSGEIYAKVPLTYVAAKRAAPEVQK